MAGAASSGWASVSSSVKWLHATENGRAVLARSMCPREEATITDLSQRIARFCPDKYIVN